MKTKKARKVYFNIFWEKYSELRKSKSQSDFLDRLESQGISRQAFYYHCRQPMENLDFKYILLYGKILNLTLNEIQEWTEKHK